jgi:hypothetical protein
LSPRGRFTVVAGLGLLVVLVIAGVSWNDIVVRYHVRRLVRDPAFFPELVDSPEGRNRSRALDAFALRPEGKKALLTLFERDIVGGLEKDRPAFSRDKYVIRLLLYLGARHCWIGSKRLDSGALSTTDVRAPSAIPPRRYETLRRYLPLLRGETLVLSGRPHLRWTFVPLSRVRDEIEADRVAGRPPLLPEAPADFAPLSGPEDTICLLEPRGEEAASTFAASLDNKFARYNAARALASLGPAGAAALPELKRALAENEDEQPVPGEPDWMAPGIFRDAVVEALRRLQPGDRSTP